MLQHWRASAADQGRSQPIRRFDPRYWLTNFPRPMLASVVTEGAETLGVRAQFQRRGDLAGLIWESEDRWSHPLCAYATNRDYRGLQWRFRWQSAGLLGLDAVNGPVLTIEGRDAAGAARAWYVRLWNYASGTPFDAEIALDFDTLAGGFLLPAEADPVFAGDIDRLFISLVPPDYDGSETALAAPHNAMARLTTLALDGPGSVLAMGDPAVPPHKLRLCTAYDDSYNQTPERLLEQAQALGYHGPLVHYLGMSHFMALEAEGSRFLVDATQALNAPAAAWHADFLARAKGLGFAPILSLSMELFAAYCPDDWAQRDSSGSIGLTGWEPPSALLSPAHAGAQAWLASVVTALMQLALAAGVAPAFQMGEPWWWVGPNKRPCFYDAASVALHVAERGGPPPVIADIRDVATAAERAFLDWAGTVLARATAALAAAARAAAPGCTTLLLFYAPQVLDRAAPDLVRANAPLGWARPAFDVLQLEEYTFVTGDDQAGQAAARALVAARWGYPLAEQHYFSGFVLRPDQAEREWPLVLDAAAAAIARGVPQVFVWAWPQLARDGVTAFQLGEQETAMAFHDVLFPLELGYGATGGPGFSTR
ncbi:MAG: TIGR02217 family protein, partial [Sphingomonadales bacterium]